VNIWCCRLYLDERLILEEVAGTSGWIFELVGGERAVFFALPPALADAVDIALLAPIDDANNLHSKRLRNDCNCT
jgi:hypothetical protein